MRRLIAPAVLVLLAATPVFALRVAIPIQAPAVRAVNAQVVVVGKVTAIEKETVEAEPYPKAPKVAYKIAVVEIQDGLAGAGSLTHIKIGFQPPPPVQAQPIDPNVPRLSSSGRPQAGPQLAEKQEGCFFLTKHPSANFYVLSPMRPALDVKSEDYKSQIAEVKKGLAIVADPMKALKAEKPEERFLAAKVLLNKYRSNPEPGQPVTMAAVSAEESQLILKAISERTDWAQQGDYTAGPTYLVNMLGLQATDGWQPKFTGNGDYNTFMRDQFKAWYAANGAKYAIKKYVAKDK